MKYCPKCKRQYTEAWLAFCSDDGSPLIQELSPSVDPNWDPNIREPKTQTASEQETQWLPKEPQGGGWIAPDERPPMQPGPWQPQPPPNVWQPPQPPSPYVGKRPVSQNLAIASLITGIAGFVLSGCLGPFPGIVALVLGIVALSQAKKSPEVFGGKPMAIAGIVIGSVTILFYVALLLWVILASALT